MADAQLMEEELQQSVMKSEQEAELALDGVDEDVAMGDESVFASQSHIDVGASGTDGEDDHEMDNDDEQRNQYGDDDRSGSGSSEDDEDGDDDDDDAFEEDADGEEEDEVISRDRHARRRTAAASLDNNQEDGDDDEDEGVGAVKIKPGETDNEDDSSDDSASSASVSDAESDDGAEWEGAENDDGEDDESENTTGNCIFCKQDEDNDPAEEFEVFLACTKCGDNAHQQCARENNALASEDGPENWRCPKCADDESDLDLAADANGNAVDMEGIADTRTSPYARRASAPKLARDLLPSQKGAIKPDSHSVFNQLVLDGDPMDGSRVLRKRKTSSAEADENIMALRKRRKNAADDQSNDEAATRQDGSSRPVSGSLRLKIPNPPASIVERSDGTVLVKMRVNSSELRQILSRKPRPRKRSGRSGRRARRAEASRAPAVPLAPIATPFTSTAYSQPFYSLYDKETDELKGKPYGGILTEAEADTSKTMPTNEDRRRFDEAKQKAEEEWRERLLRAQSEVDVPAKRPRKASGPASQIECIQFGDYEIDTWYAAPYPEEYSRNRVLFICEFCLKYMNSDYVAWRHKLKCPAKHPPGDEIYRHGSVSVFEVDGRKNPVYCQNLCLLAKLFLGSKTLYYDVEPFLFYVLCEYNDLGYHFVGYFSKEKRASSQNNVSCILTLPIHQRKGYGNLLIDFSYLLTRVEKKTGSPEKPLSDMGLVSYRNYWRLVMCRYLLQQFPDGKPGKHGLSIRKISDDTGLTPDDVISALEGLRCLVRDPQTQLYAFRVDLQYCREYVAKWEAKNYVQLNESALTWTPYVMGRSSATNFELGPALTAIAPREEEEEQKPVVAAGESLANGTESSHQPDTPDQEVKDTADTMVLESTEPNDAGSAVNGDSKPNGILVNGNSIEQNDQPKPEQETAKITGENWIMQYKDIPPTRFEVWPPITGSRRGDRSRGYIPRPPVVRTGDSASKPRPRRSTGSRRSTAARPKTSSSSSSKRKPGGTGRGPGRWPKGTKKSDYGNADSGPGFPPGWIAERARVAVLAAAKKEGNKENGGSDVKDTVQVQSPTVKEASKAQRGKENADVDMQDADGHAEDE